MILCDYGCGQEGKFQFKNGKLCCSKSQNSCPEIKRKTGEPKRGKVGPNKNRTFSKEWKENIRKSLEGKNTAPKSEETKQKMRKPKTNTEKMGRYIRTKEWCENISNLLKVKMLGKNNPMYNKKHSNKTKKLISSINLEYYLKNNGPWLNKKMSDESKKRMSISKKELFKDEKFLKKFREQIKNSKIASPNKQEIIILEVLNFLSLGYKYVGDHSIWINGKNPDFLKEEEKKIIELFGKHWHENEDEKIRKDHFEKEGYKTLVIWDYELRNLEKLKGKILEFERENQ